MRRMKKFSSVALSFLFLLSFDSLALSLDVVGPCSTAPVFQTQFNLSSAPQTLGHATIEILTLHHVPFDGTDAGIRSILKTPTGDDALEVISDREMRAYGWCVQIDGRQPKAMPDQVSLNGSEHVRWYYGYAHYLSGKWISYCEPAFNVKPASLCSR